ncbi:hypothetical protein K6K15_09180 [Lacticaseibacillus paracasei]|jgi:hypothetical protein|uniref:hypothetical protein n=1 Tax=Lacticaseibacillus paracasei TaxID=1597 RepID=UPI00029844B7|nr:hypothetical protein [Lacticaseibacillus paracasei]EKQ09276.1 hypothetical protein LCAM36_0723 [Lacticaseibacillus paracasei]EKQ20489.1 hypothetical protein LCAUW1_1937 [Lacticaseibacillus paracasei]MDE5157094.1 hypothetical protein [Lacticaseibacillus paracasei]MDM7550319.1 hypothetical protein [Lacticaseibacillus paracasei]MDS0815834.1 hypothetical protein [Lacticaseibacillus paracasei]
MSEKKKLSVWAYLNEAQYCLTNRDAFDVERIESLIAAAYRIFTGQQVGDFEEDFLNDRKNKGSN